MPSAAHHSRAVHRARRHASRRRAEVRAPGAARSRTWPAVVLAFAVVTVLAGLGWLVWPADTVRHTPARATVIEPAECGGAAGRDVVRFEFGGRSVQAELDGCGNRAGAQITIEVPDAAVHDGMTVRLAGTGVTDSTLTARRLTAVLLVFAAAAGAVLAWRLAPHGDIQG